MSFESIHPAQLALFAFEVGEEIPAENQEMPEMEEFNFKDALLKTALKEYKFAAQLQFEGMKKIKEFVDSFSSLNFIFGKTDSKTASLTKAPFFELAAKTSLKEAPSSKMALQSSESHYEAAKDKPMIKDNVCKPNSPSSHRVQGKNETQPNETTRANSQSRSEQAQKWSHQETIPYWENRYLRREDEKQQKRDQGQGQKEKDEKKQKVQKIEKKCSVSGTSHSETFSSKPVLERPKMGVFALYYILTKLGILSDGSSNYAYKKEIEIIDAETTKAHQSRLEEMKKALEKEEASRRWGVTQKVFSWMGSLFGIIAGVILIATGVGAVAGAMLIAAGIIQITNQILELTGGWTKIAELLPGESIEKKRAVVSWIQIGITVLCLVLSGVGIIFGGFSQLSDAMSTASNCIGAIATMGQGVTSIGEGITQFMYTDRLSEAKRFEKILAELRHQREDLMDKVDWGLDRLQQLFEDLTKALEFEVELFRADQMINFRG